MPIEDGCKPNTSSCVDTASLHALVPGLLDYLVEQEQVPPCQTIGGQLMCGIARLDDFERALVADAARPMASTAAILMMTIIWMLNQQVGDNWALRSTTPRPRRLMSPTELTRPIRRMLVFAYHAAYTNKGRVPRADIGISLEIALTSLCRIVDLLQLPVRVELEAMAVAGHDD